MQIYSSKNALPGRYEYDQYAQLIAALRLTPVYTVADCAAQLACML
jgi:hypothetical protein